MPIKPTKEAIKKGGSWNDGSSIILPQFSKFSKIVAKIKQINIGFRVIRNLESN